MLDGHLTFMNGAPTKRVSVVNVLLEGIAHVFQVNQVTITAVIVFV